MRSTITERGQTVIPAAIRKQLGLSPADRLEWIVLDGRMIVTPVASDPIDAFRGRGKGGTTGRLLADRQAEKAREDGNA
ncbi:AbrB/MazE/SpoVT family DNA-binding domain-containing protein [Endothiovibrio diazotrophicus]